MNGDITIAIKTSKLPTLSPLYLFLVIMNINPVTATIRRTKYLSIPSLVFGLFIPIVVVSPLSLIKFKDNIELNLYHTHNLFLDYL